MGKGDIKSKRGKIARGTYGVRRKRKKSVAYVAPVVKPVKKAKVEPVTDEEAPAKKTVAKKPAAKKTAAKKPAAKKTTTKKAAADKKTD